MEIRVSHPDDMIWDLLLEADPEAQKVMAYLDLGQTYVAIEENDLLGVIVIQHVENKIVEVKNLSVKRDYQRRGVASQLLMYVTDKVTQEMPESVIYVKTASTSYPALALYKRLGFVLTDIVENYFPTHYQQPIFENGQQAIDQYILTYRK